MSTKRTAPKVRIPGNFPEASVEAIALERIAWPKQPREEFDAETLSELATSMSHRGLLNPIGLIRQGDAFGGVFGERRFRAAKMLGWESIPALIFTEGMVADDADRLECALVENLVRSDLKPIETARTYRELMTARSWTAKELSRRIGRSEAGISQALALLKLEPSIQEDVEEGRLPASTAYEITKKPVAIRRALATSVQTEHLKRDEVKRNRKPAPVVKAVKPATPRLTLPDGIIVRRNTIVVAKTIITNLDELLTVLERIRLAAEQARAEIAKAELIFQVVNRRLNCQGMSLLNLTTILGFTQAPENAD